MGFDPKRLHTGIFGPGLSGKTTLAVYLSRMYWQNHRVKSLVLDPNFCLEGNIWGSQAWVTDDEEKFWDMAWHREVDCALFVDEAAETIKRDNEKTALFTRIRHRRGPGGPGHRLHVIGHSGSNLLPVQRQQIHTLYLFRQDPDSADLWSRQFADERIQAATTLNQYQFLWCRLYHAPEPHSLKI